MIETISLFKEDIPESGCVFMRDKDIDVICSYYDDLNDDDSHMMSSDDICTPMSCVKLMVDYIPKEFWNRKSLKVLDPCCGNGNFGAYIMSKTSMDNIWFNEISPVRYSNCKRILNPEHISNSDFFDIYDRFDLVVMNPPYSGGGNKNQSLSNRFIEYAIDLLNDTGYLCVVAPNNWMSYNNDNITLKKLLSRGSFMVIDNDIKKYFSGVGSSFTVFLWQKGVCDHKTRVINNYLLKDEQYVYLDENMKFIPLYLSQETIDLSVKCVGKENGIDYRCDLHNFTQKNKMKDEQDEEYCYETIHTAKKTRYANEKQDIYNKWTVIIPLSNYFIPFIRTNVNVTQSVAYVSFDDKKEAEEMVRTLEQDYVKVLVHLTRYGNFNNVMLLKHIRLNGVILNENEQDIIKKLIKKIKY